MYIHQTTQRVVKFTSYLDKSAAGRKYRRLRPKGGASNIQTCLLEDDVDGVVLTLTNWSNRTGISATTIYKSLKSGQSIKEALGSGHAEFIVELRKLGIVFDPVWMGGQNRPSAQQLPTAKPFIPYAY